VVFLQGDRFGRLNLRTGEFERTGDKDVDTAQLQKNAEFLSRQSKTTRTSVRDAALARSIARATRRPPQSA